MGITPAVLRAIQRYLPVERMFSLAYPDMVMTLAEFEEITGKRPTQINPSGGEHDVSGAMPETVEAISLLGVEQFKCVDIARLRGVEEIADLNVPNDFGKHDLVLDAGTTEHCANIWQATINAANAVDDGGVVFHQVPLTMVNHGFFCPQPTFYFDLYAQNGWKVEQLFITDGKRAFDIDPHKRSIVASELVLCVAARRRGLESLRYPVQHKYQKLMAGRA